MCYFCWASHIERTNNLFQLKRAAAPVTAGGAVLHRITSSFEKPPPRLADCDLKGNRALQEQLVWPGSGEREGWGWQSGSNLVQKLPQKIVLQLRWREEEEEGDGGGGGGGRRREEAKAINRGFSPGLPLLLHVGRGGKLIMWLRLIR